MLLNDFGVMAKGVHFIFTNVNYYALQEDIMNKDITNKEEDICYSVLLVSMFTAIPNMINLNVKQLV